MKKHQILQISDTAAMLRVCVSTLRRWHKSGKLKPHTILWDGSRIYLKEDIEKFIQKRKK